MPQKAIPVIFCILFFYSFGSKQQDDTDIAHFNTTSQKLVGNGYDFEKQEWVKVELYRFGGEHRTNNSALIRFCKKHTLT